VLSSRSGLHCCVLQHGGVGDPPNSPFEHRSLRTMHTNFMAQQHLKCQPVPRQRQGTTFRPFQQPSRHTNVSQIFKPAAHNRRSSLLMTAGGAGLWLAAGGVVAAGAAAAAGLFGGSNPQDLVRSGMSKFRKVSNIHRYCLCAKSLNRSGTLYHTLLC
jgi:hypothetical protein